jgi:hypothetical protein
MNQLVVYGAQAAQAYRSATPIGKMTEIGGLLGSPLVEYLMSKVIPVDPTWPELLGNTTQTLQTTTSLLDNMKYVSGNMSESILPSFKYLIENQAELARAQTKVFNTQNLIFKNRLTFTQGMALTTSCGFTVASLAEMVYTPNPLAKNCFALGFALNGLGTICTTLGMCAQSSGHPHLFTFGTILQSIGTGCFWGGKHCQRLARMTNVTKVF